MLKRKNTSTYFQLRDFSGSTSISLPKFISNNGKMHHAFVVNFRVWLFSIKPSLLYQKPLLVGVYNPNCQVESSYPLKMRLFAHFLWWLHWLGQVHFCELYLVPPKNWLRLSVFPYQKVIVFTFVFGSWNRCNLLIYIGISLILLPFFEDWKNGCE